MHWDEMREGKVVYIKNNRERARTHGYLRNGALYSRLHKVGDQWTYDIRKPANE